MKHKIETYCEEEMRASLAVLSELRKAGKKFTRHHNRRKLMKNPVVQPTLNRLIEKKGVPYERLTDAEIEVALNSLYGLYQGRYLSFKEMKAFAEKMEK